MTSKKPRYSTEVDALVGRNIRMFRQIRHMSQEKLAEALGLTFQQVQKYEKGTNRVSAGRLFEIADILGVGITDLFHGAELPEGDNTEMRRIIKVAMEFDAMPSHLQDMVRRIMRAVVKEEQVREQGDAHAA